MNTKFLRVMEKGEKNFKKFQKYRDFLRNQNYKNKVFQKKKDKKTGP